MTGADSVGLRLVDGDLEADGLGLSVIVANADGVPGAGGCVAAAERDERGDTVGLRLSVCVRLAVFDADALVDDDADSLCAGLGDVLGEGVTVAADCVGGVEGVG